VDKNKWTVNIPLDKMVEKIIDFLNSKIPDLQLIYLFGSQADGTQNADSDVDIAFFATNLQLSAIQKWTIQQELAIILNCDTDLIDLDSASITLSHQILSLGKRIYAKEEFDYDNYELLIIKRFLDFQQTTKELREDIMKRGKVYG
jgi:predicted nucleotidyltransferase